MQPEQDYPSLADPPLRSSYGLHQPYALRNVIELESEDGIVGIVETAVESNRRGAEVHATGRGSARIADGDLSLRGGRFMV